MSEHTDMVALGWPPTTHWLYHLMLTLQVLLSAAPSMDSRDSGTGTMSSGS